MSNVKGMCVLSWRYTTSLGPWVKVHSRQCRAGQCGGGVRPWLPTGKSDEVMTAVLSGFEFEVMDDEVQIVKEKLDTSYWPAYIRTESWHYWQDDWWAKMSKHYIVRLDANWHSNWHSNPTDVGNRIVVFRDMIPTFIPLWVERYKCDSSLQQFDFCSSSCFSRWGLLFLGECLANWTWYSLVVYMHFTVAMLIPQRCCNLLTAVPCMDEVWL